MPPCFRYSFLFLLTLILLTYPAELAAQSGTLLFGRRPAVQQRVSSRFSTPSSATANPTSATSVPAGAPPTAQSIMQRQTFMDGQTPTQWRRKHIELSVHLLPTLTWNSVSGAVGPGRFDSPGVSLQYSVGPSADLYLGESWYALSTGLWYTTKRVGITHPATDGGGLSTFTLGYVQLPLTMKLFSDNLIKTGWTYVQYGLTLDLKAGERALDKANNVLYRRYQDRAQFRGGDVSLLLAAGFVRRISLTKSIIVSLQYQRGLINSFAAPGLISKNNLLALGAGLHF